MVMKIKNATYNVIYPKVNNIRKEIFKLEEKLNGLFVQPFSLISIPDDAPAEIPRISANSRFGHSSLNISLNTAQYTVNYDENYNRDIDKCFEYMKKHVKEVFKSIASATSEDYLFTGLTLEILLDDINKEDPVDIITKRFYSIESPNKPFDISNRVTYVLEDKYYINISVSNIRSYKGMSPNSINQLIGLQQISNDICINLDINDRYAFNYKKYYKSSEKELDKILKLAYSILSDKICDYIEKGVLKL